MAPRKLLATLLPTRSKNKSKPDTDNNSTKTKTSTFERIRTLPNPEPKREKTTFLSLPPELRNEIYTLHAASISLSLFSPPPSSTPSTSSPTVPSSKPPSPPSFLLTTRQTRTEYLPLLLATAPLHAHVYNYDFARLRSLVSSLYARELKALRANADLRILLHLNPVNKKGEVSSPSVANLRRWAESRAKGLDRLAWGYEVVLPANMYVRMGGNEGRDRRLWEILLEVHADAVARLHRGVHESLAWEIEPVSGALDRGIAVVTGEG